MHHLNLAAEYTFGKNCIENNNTMLLNNGLDTKKFTYSVNERYKIRKQLGIEEEKNSYRTYREI